MFVLWIDDTSALGDEAFDKTSWRWCRVGPGPRQEGEGALAEIADELARQPDEVRLILKAGDCLDCWLKVPPMNSRRLTQAIPFIAEELVAQPLEAMHFVPGERRGELLRCVAISRVFLQRLLDKLHTYSIHPTALFTDAGLLRTKTDSISVLKDGDRALIRTDALAAEVPCARVPIVIDSLLRKTAESDAEIHIEVAGDDRGSLAERLSKQFERVSRRSLTGSRLADLLPGLEAAAANILVGDFEQVKSTAQTPRRKLPIALAAMLLTIVLVSDLIVGVLARQRASASMEQAAQVYAQAFPAEEPSPLEIIRLVNHEQGTGPQETARLIGMLNSVSNILSANGAQVRSLSYQSASDALDVEILVEGYDSLDTLESQVAGDSRAVSMLGATQAEDGVRARLRISGQGL